MATQELTISQKCAINRVRRIASRLQTEHPEILTLYRDGSSLPKIVNRLSLCEEYGLSTRVAITSVSAALRGCSNPGLGLNPLKGLLDTKEADELSRKHRQEYNEEAEKSGSGLYALTYEERSNACKIGGAISCKNNLELHILSKPEVHRAGSKKGVTARGQIPWKEREITPTYCRLSEKEFTLMLYQSKEYRTWQGRTDVEKIKDLVNDVYHNGEPVRTYQAIIQTMSKIKNRF